MTSPPVTYLLTFSCYGTRLHGDARGSVHRDQDLPNSRFVEPSPAWESFERHLMTESAYELDVPLRDIASRTIQEVCAHRKWTLFALHIRNTHVHVVADIDREPERAVNDFKAYITRRIRENGLDAGRKHFWSLYGSNVRLGNSEAVKNGVVYVIDKQGAPMTTFLHENWLR